MTVSKIRNTNKKLSWGPSIDLSTIEYLYPPQNVEPYTPPSPGVDNLGITSTDTFMIPNVGEFTVDFKGFVRVARSKPTTDEWVTAEVFTNLIHMCMRGEHPDIGPIVVTLNPDFLSAGQLRTPFRDMESVQPAKACRMAVGAYFNVPNLGLTFFNKEPIELTIDNVQMIPPSGNPGEGRIYQILPLFDINNPDANPVAYLTSLHFAMGNYIKEVEIQRILNDEPVVN
ncbi:MAG: DUF6073 family protein [Crocosphaera sp.]